MRCNATDGSDVTDANGPTQRPMRQATAPLTLDPSFIINIKLLGVCFFNIALIVIYSCSFTLFVANMIRNRFVARNKIAFVFLIKSAFQRLLLDCCLLFSFFVLQSFNKLISLSLSVRWQRGMTFGGAGVAAVVSELFTIPRILY